MVQSKLLLSYRDVSHSFSGREGASGSYVVSTQVHGNRVRIVTEKEQPQSEADAMVTTKNITLAIQTADCLPILLYDPKRRIAGAVHAGWKSLLSGVIHNTLLAMTKSGSTMRAVVAAIGPSIGVCCYDVPTERVILFQRFASSEYPIAKKRNKKWYLNLKHIALQQMLKEGVSIHHIEDVSVCTQCNAQFFSFRRGLSESQRNMSMIHMI